MTEEEERPVSAEDAQRRSLWKLRRSHFHRIDNEAEKRWQQIAGANHLAEAIAEAITGRGPR